jgi:hypothetical protein
MHEAQERNMHIARPTRKKVLSRTFALVIRITTKEIMLNTPWYETAPSPSGDE